MQWHGNQTLVLEFWRGSIKQRKVVEDNMTRWMIALSVLGLFGAVSVDQTEAAKAQKKKAEKVEYLRAAGSEPPPAPARPMKKKTKAAE